MSNRPSAQAADLIERLNAITRVTARPRWQRMLWRPERIVRSHLQTATSRMLGRPLQVRARTFWGERMSVAVPEIVAKQILRYGFYEEGLTRMLLALLRSGMTFADVGAHVGYYSLLAAHVVGRAGRVLAFEPVPATFELLTRNTGHCWNVRRVQAAVFSETGTLEFSDHGLEFSAFASFTRPRLRYDVPPPTPIEVRSVRLDEFVRDLDGGPLFVKIDVESAEAHVLQGMHRVIDELRPVISLEVGDFDLPGVPPSRELIDALAARRYRVFEYGTPSEPLRLHAPRERYGYDNLVFVPE
ncbi:MAG TPA: FkbM family methyltransferase [Longimicrobiales bacterium]|nr:FkbM family methyltransferase [Longimicrobiales bacterium]